MTFLAREAQPPELQTRRVDPHLFYILLRSALMKTLDWHVVTIFEQIT
jgi:hypothetical protein